MPGDPGLEKVNFRQASLVLAFPNNIRNLGLDEVVHRISRLEVDTTLPASFTLAAESSPSEKGNDRIPPASSPVSPVQHEQCLVEDDDNVGQS